MDKVYTNGLDDLKKIQTELLHSFISFCVEENLEYFAMFGTMIGAVRHGGFIPWDDDIDLVMPRQDYDRLNGMTEKFKEPYFLQTPENDPGACPGFIRYMNLRTSFIPPQYPNSMLRGGRLGCGIDILPLDEAPNKRAAEKLARKAEKYRQLRFRRAPIEEMPLSEMPEWKRKSCRMLFPKSYSELTRRYDEICARYSGRGVKYYTIPVIAGDHRALIMERRSFGSYVEADFEGLSIRIPVGWRKISEEIYENGAELPDESERKTRHSGFVDTSAPYTKYTARYEDVFKGARGKRIILFGAGNMLNIYMNHYGTEFPPECSFDNDPEKWGKILYGVRVFNPKEIPGFLDDNTRIIIISLYHKEISKQLEEMGIFNYYVYIDGWRYDR